MLNIATMSVLVLRQVQHLAQNKFIKPVCRSIHKAKQFYKIGPSILRQSFSMLLIPL